MSQMGIAADDSFVCKVNDVAVMSGNGWNILSQKDFEFAIGNNLVEIAVTNFGGPGGLLASVLVEGKEIGTDKYWEASLDGKSWDVPDQITPYGQGIWAKYGGVPGVKPNTKAQWIWISRAPEKATVYFRKTIVVGSPEPEPNPNPDQSAEIERLKTELYEMTVELNKSVQIEKDTQLQLEVVEEKRALAIKELEEMQERDKFVSRRLTDLKNTLNWILE